MWGALFDGRMGLSFTMYNIHIYILHVSNSVAQIVFKIIPRHGPHRKHPRFHCYSLAVAAA
jgi:hypothetical protein